jgi:prophage antirepressor-like protein
MAAGTMAAFHFNKTWEDLTMNTNLQNFRHDEFGSIRVIEIDGQPWFVGRDVADALGYTNGSRDINRHVDAEDRQNYRNGTSEINNRGITIINESGLYALILSSKLATAKKFKRWVTGEVLPSIRRHGAYITGDMLDSALGDPDLALELFRKLRAEQGRTDALMDRVEALAPKARYCDAILRCKNAVPVTLIAKDYGMSATAFNRLLHSMGIQHRVGATWVLYQKYAGNGYTKSNTYYIPSGIGVIYTCWTQKGRLFLYDKLACYGIYPVGLGGGYFH